MAAKKFTTHCARMHFNDAISRSAYEKLNSQVLAGQKSGDYKLQLSRDERAALVRHAEANVNLKLGDGHSVNALASARIESVRLAALIAAVDWATKTAQSPFRDPELLKAYKNHTKALQYLHDQARDNQRSTSQAGASARPQP